MTDQDYIATGYKLIGWDSVRYKALVAKVGPEIVHDHIAAQLVRQVNALDEYAIHIEPGKTILCGITYTDKGFESHHTVDVCEGDDPTDNTITVIVDSKVLK